MSRKKTPNEKNVVPRREILKAALILLGGALVGGGVGLKVLLSPTEEEKLDKLEEILLNETEYGQSILQFNVHIKKLQQEGKLTITECRDPKTTDKDFRYKPETNNILLYPLSVQFRKDSFANSDDPHKLMARFHENLHAVQDLNSPRNVLENLVYIEEKMLDPNNHSGSFFIKYTPNFLQKYAARVMSREELEKTKDVDGTYSGSKISEHFVRTWDSFQATAFERLAIMEAHAYFAMTPPIAPTKDIAEYLYSFMIKTKYFSASAVKPEQFVRVYEGVQDAYSIFADDPRGEHRVVAEFVGLHSESFSDFFKAIEKLKTRESSDNYQKKGACLDKRMGDFFKRAREIYHREFK